jgi:hypothetical protein
MAIALEYWDWSLGQSSSKLGLLEKHAGQNPSLVLKNSLSYKPH